VKTMRELNRYLSKASNNCLEIVKGDGYFWYRQTDKEFEKNPSKVEPAIELVYRINHWTPELWKEALDDAAKEYGK
jgi:hypothetical protein